MTSQQISTHESRNISDFLKYSEYVISKYQRKQQTSETVVHMVTEIVALTENIFTGKLYKKYGTNKRMMVLDQCKKLYPGNKETEAILEMFFAEKIEQVLKNNTKQ